jgi:hypothetical protein
MTSVNIAVNKIRFFFVRNRLLTRFNLVVQLCTILIKYYSLQLSICHIQKRIC